MKDNPTIWIELGSHTDSRGNDQYNQWLSQSRANSAVQYIIYRGIEKNRITAKGYGEHAAEQMFERREMLRGRSSNEQKNRI